jgi:uncharacterized protein (DUF2384 family)
MKHKPVLAVGTTVTRTLESLPYVWKIVTHKKYMNNDCTEKIKRIPQDVYTFRIEQTKDITIEQSEKYIRVLPTINE